MVLRCTLQPLGVWLPFFIKARALRLKLEAGSPAHARCVHASRAPIVRGRRASCRRAPWPITRLVDEAHANN